MPFDADQTIQQLMAQRMLERENHMGGAEDRIRQFQKMRGQENPQQKFQVWPDPPPGQGPRQVAPDPQPPHPTPQPRSVLLRRGMQ
jgi:hypothetical protein